MAKLFYEMLPSDSDEAKLEKKASVYNMCPYGWRKTLGRKQS
jgi:hypothetical protein